MGWEEVVGDYASNVVGFVLWVLEHGISLGDIRGWACGFEVRRLTIEASIDYLLSLYC